MSEPDTVTLDAFDVRVLREKVDQMRKALDYPGRITVMNKAARELMHAAERVTATATNEGTK